MKPAQLGRSFLVLLAPIVLVGGAPLPGRGAPAAPRGTNGVRSGENEKTAVRLEAARLLTGSPEHLQSVVAGVPPTAVLKVVPVPAKVGSYPGGTTIVGNELTAFTGGFRAWFEFKLSDWDPNGDNSPPLWIWQIGADKTGYLGVNAVPSNPGVNLAPPVIACVNNAACTAAFGESWATCDAGSGTCMTAYVDSLGTGRPDSWCADTGSGACVATDCDVVSASAPRCFGIYAIGVPRPDAGIEYQGATLVLDIPPTAQGKYTVNLSPAETFLADTAQPGNDIPTLSETGFVVNVLAPTVQACCHVAGGCTDLDSADCANAGDTPQGAGTDCTSAPCGPPPGACCNRGTSSCTDGVLEADCASPLEWTAGTLCVNLPSPCLATGACCDSSPGAGGPGSEGACTDDQFAADCTGPNKVWTANTACAQVTCLEAVGACCDPSPGVGGACWENVLQAQCLLFPQVWTQGVACAGIVCEEARGSCCNSTTFDCTNSVLQGDCLGADVVWQSGATCESCASGALIRLRPVPAKVGSYPAGTTITGNELTALPGGFRAWFELKLRNWDSDGDNDPPLQLWQFGADANGYKGVNADPPNPGVDLTPPVVACTNDATCVTAFGEAWATCEPFNGTCNTAYTDRPGTGRPDSWCADTGSGPCDQGDCDNLGPNAPRCFGLYRSGIPRPDEGIDYYGATLVLDIPAGALGRYTVNLNPDATFLYDTAIPPNEILGIAETGFVVNIVSSAPPIDWDPAELASTRSSHSLTMSLTSATGSGGVSTTAIQIKMIDLQHPVPHNRPQYPPQNFTAFDTATNGVCSGATTSPNFNNHHCDASIPDCVGPNNSVATDDGTCGSLSACTAAGEANGCARWVGPVATFREKQDVLSLGTYQAARLQCTPYYRDWSTVGLFTVFGAELLPSSTYEGRVFGSDCKGMESTCTNVSQAVTMRTRRSADVAAPFNPGTLPETDQPDGGDVVAVLNKFKGLVGSPSNTIALLQPNAIDPNVDVGSLDIGAAVDAFKGLPYPYSGPCPCPSSVTCGAVECPLNSCGAGVCVKTCQGGTNAGLPCGDNTHDHCPGGNCPSTGFCRDRCGRCQD